MIVNAISWIEDSESKQNDENLSSRVNISESIRRTSRLDYPGRLSNVRKHKLINIVTSGRSKKPQRQCRVCAIK